MIYKNARCNAFEMSFLLTQSAHLKARKSQGEMCLALATRGEHILGVLRLAIENHIAYATSQHGVEKCRVSTIIPAGE